MPEGNYSNGEESRKELENQLQEIQKQRALEIQRRQLLKQILAPEAYERMANIRSANPELYMQLASLLIYLYQNGQLRGTISEEQLKGFIAKILEKQRRETRITRISK